MYNSYQKTRNFRMSSIPSRLDYGSPWIARPKAAYQGPRDFEGLRNLVNRPLSERFVFKADDRDLNDLGGWRENHPPVVFVDGCIQIYDVLPTDVAAEGKKHYRQQRRIELIKTIASGLFTGFMLTMIFTKRIEAITTLISISTATALGSAASGVVLGTCFGLGVAVAAYAFGYFLRSCYALKETHKELSFWNQPHVPSQVAIARAELVRIHESRQGEKFDLYDLEGAAYTYGIITEEEGDILYNSIEGDLQASNRQAYEDYARSKGTLSEQAYLNDLCTRAASRNHL